MIYKTLQFTSNVLNKYLKDTFGIIDQVVIVNKLVDQAGIFPSENQNKIIITLVNIHKEENTKELDKVFNLNLLVSSNFSDYLESLKFLDATINFFESKTSFPETSSSNFPKEIEYLNFELENLKSYNNRSDLWNIIGANQIPSVVYKVHLKVLN